MLLKFTKMHGLGYDFIVIDLVTQHLALTEDKIRFLADRRRGIGCDQILTVEPPQNPEVDFRYRIYNCDGTEVEQCGNGARCFAKFVVDRKLIAKNLIKVETSAGTIELSILDNGEVEVDMGIPEFMPSAIPIDTTAEQSTYTLNVNGEEISFVAVSMGNPHAVIIVESTLTAAVSTLGPILESHSFFPHKTNVGFMQIVSRSEINLRVYERGVGETQACGTGACAAVVAGIHLGLLDSEVKTNLTGGTLMIRWEGRGTSVIMTGPATTVYQGQIQI